LITFSKKVSTTAKIILETVQKVGKRVDIHFFENVVFKKDLPVFI